MNCSRRSFIKSLSLMGATGFMPALSCATAPKSLRNVICIIGDDHAAHVMGCDHNDLAQTPNLDRLAGQGVRFTHAYANAPLCSASRQSLLTGKYPHATGVTLLTTSFPDDQLTLAEHLRERGFATGVMGKTHFNNGQDHGFSVLTDSKEWHEYLAANPPQPAPKSIKTRPPWKPFRDPARIWLNADGLPSEYHDKDDIGTWLAGESASFIREHKNDRFCLWVGFHEPHSPFNFPLEYANKYNPADMPLPPVSDEDDRWIPAIFRDLSDDDKRGIIASYYTSVAYMDKNVGIILDELDRQGLADETLVIYIGDQGYLLGHHKRFEKHMMWEQAVLSPLIMRAGKRFGPDRQINGLCEFVDLAPTILELLDIAPLPDAQGQSLIPMLGGKQQEIKDYVFSEFLADNKAMIRTRDWKYIFTSGKRDLGQGYATGNPPSGILHRLYHVPTDPYEHHDVANDPENQPILNEMQGMMLKHFMRTHPKANQLPTGLSVDEQLTWFCEPPDVGANLDAK